MEGTVKSLEALWGYGPNIVIDPILEIPDKMHVMLREGIYLRIDFKIAIHQYPPWKLLGYCHLNSSAKVVEVTSPPQAVPMKYDPWSQAPKVTQIIPNPHFFRSKQRHGILMYVVKSWVSWRGNLASAVRATSGQHRNLRAASGDATCGSFSAISVGLSESYGIVGPINNHKYLRPSGLVCEAYSSQHSTLDQHDQTYLLEHWWHRLSVVF